jgi:hypothetical protein
MSGPDRLLAGEATDFERELLGSWSRRQPSAEARARALAIVGLSGALLTTAGAAAVKAATTSIAPKAAFSGSTVMMKWIAIGLLGATATAGAVAYVRHESRGVASPPPGTLEVAPARPAVSPLPHAPVSVPPEPPPSAIELGDDPAPGVRARTPQSAARSSTLDAEVAIIDQARRAIASGDPSAALQLVSGYDAKYGGGSGVAPGDGHGALSQESTDIRIEALVLQGNRPAAERLATLFVTSHPSSPYVRHIRTLVGDPKSP